MKKNIISGIYCIENILNGKKYIGYAKNIFRRWKKHHSELRLNRHDNGYLQNIYNKYGKDIFKYWIIQECSNENLPLMEIYWISYYNSYRDDGEGYNLTRGGDGLLDPSVETRKKLSDINKGKPKSEETKQKLSMANGGKNSVWFGKKHTENTLHKMRISRNKREPASEETRRRISESRKGEKNCRFGLSLNKEITDKISRIQLGRKKNMVSTSKYIGVYYQKCKNKWGSQLTYNRKKLHIGYFPTELEAALAYNEAAIEFYGWKAKLNDISKEEIEKLWEMQIET